MTFDDQEAKQQAYAEQMAYARGAGLAGGAIGTIAGYQPEYVRGSALATALQFNAGQGVDAAKIVADAREFLAFLKDG